MKFGKLFFLVLLLLVSVSSVLAIVQLQDNRDTDLTNIFHLHLENSLYREVSLNINESEYATYTWVATPGNFYIITGIDQSIITLFQVVQYD